VQHTGLDVVANGATLERFGDGLADVRLDAGVVRPPIALPERLANDVGGFQAGGRERGLVGFHQRAFRIEHTDEGEQVVEDAASEPFVVGQPLLRRLQVVNIS
jgi:hypothetical protein